MGIEPTCDALNAPHDGFEDRGRHQAYKHFRSVTWNTTSAMSIAGTFLNLAGFRSRA